MEFRATSPVTNRMLCWSTLVRRATRIISSEMSMPTTRPSGTSLLIRRVNQPDPHPTSSTLSVAWRPIFVKNRQCDRQVILLHAVAPPSFSPAIKLFAQRLCIGRIEFSHVQVGQAPFR